MARTRTKEFVLEFADDSDPPDLPESQANAVVLRDPSAPPHEPIFLNLKLLDMLTHAFTSGNCESFVEKWKLKTKKLTVGIPYPHFLQIATDNDEIVSVHVNLGNEAGGERCQIGGVQIIIKRFEDDGQANFLDIWCRSEADRVTIWSILARLVMKIYKTDCRRVIFDMVDMDKLWPLLDVTYINCLKIAWEGLLHHGMSAQHFQRIVTNPNIQHFRFKCPGHRERFDGVFQNEIIHLEYGHWLRVENVIQMKCEQFVCVNTRFRPSDLRKVVKAWKRGRMKKMKFLWLSYEEQQEQYGLEVMRRMDCFPWHPPYKKRGNQETTDVLVRNHREKLASLQFISNTFYMRVY